MKIAVLGAGVIGVTTAYELARRGHRVRVIDQRPEAAAETSRANGGLLTSGYTLAWASLDLLRDLPLILLGANPTFRVPLANRDPLFWRFALPFLMQCTAGRFRRNTLRKYRLAVYSQAVLHEIAEKENLKFHLGDKGLYYLYRSGKTFAHDRQRLQILADHGQPQRILTPQQLAAEDTSYTGAARNIAGAIHCPTDASGDCQRFTHALAGRCREMGVEFHFNHEISALDLRENGVAAVKSTGGDVEAERFVVCLGPWSPLLLGEAGIRIPVYPVKGYSLTFPVTASHRPPLTGGLDEDKFIAYSTLGDHFRVTSKVELSGFDKSHEKADFKPITRAIRQLFPDAADYERPEYWSCLRPVTPTGFPFLGPTTLNNLYLNTGHGSLGWTMACGSARITADLLEGREPEISLTG